MTQSLYQDHFGIRENPFSIIPDPHYLYMSQRHQEALAHLLYGISESGGFVLLTGEVGTGKTTICRALIEQLPQNVNLALILNPRLTELELMASICDEMRIPYPLGTKSLKDFFDFMNRYLLDAHARGRNPVLMIDEAQNLSPQVLELIRLLTNLETAEKKLLQIILVGQPELNHILAQENQRQTAQRITARYHLMPLGLVETRNYINHRLHVAGLSSTVFTTGAIKAIHKTARGIPRLINSICDRALLAAYAEGRMQVSSKMARSAAAEVLGIQVLTPATSVWRTLALALAITGLIFWVGFDPYRTGIKDTLSALIEPLLPPAPESVEPAPVASEPVVAAAPTPPPAPQPSPAQTPPETPTDAPAEAQVEPPTAAPIDAPQDVSQSTGTVLGDMIDASTPDRAF
ncbi:MAG: AAA family ATPase, partial [Rhodospirillales bacterium]|nr:AAA family ATPase [Rhodospirillales bacterium]